MKKYYILLIVTLISPLYTIDYTWDGGSTGDWETATNWDLDLSFPNATTDKATLGGNDDFTINLNQDITLQQLEITVNTGRSVDLENVGDTRKITFSGAGDGVAIYMSTNQMEGLTINQNVELAENEDFRFQIENNETDNSALTFKGTFTALTNSNLLISADYINDITFENDVTFNGGTITLQSNNSSIPELTFNTTTTSPITIAAPITTNDGWINTTTSSTGTVIFTEVVSAGVYAALDSNVQIQKPWAVDIRYSKDLTFLFAEDTVISSGIQANGVSSHLIIDGDSKVTFNDELSFSLFNQATISANSTAEFRYLIRYAGSAIINNFGSLILNPSYPIQYNINLLESGPLTITGNSTATVSGDLTGYSGAITIEDGTTLNLQANAGSVADLEAALAPVTVTVDAGGTLQSEATIVGTLVNNGTVIVGDGVGDTLTVTDYTQSSEAALEIDIAPTTIADKIVVTNDANLAGDINLTVANGSYTKGSQFTILTANAITGTFDQVIEDHPYDFRLIHQTNQVLLELIQPVVQLPTPVNLLGFNARSAANYLYNQVLQDIDTVVTETDFEVVGNLIAALPADEFGEAIVRISPLASMGLVYPKMKSDFEMAVILDKQYKKSKRMCQEFQATDERLSDIPLYAQPQTGFFIEPVGVFLNQRARQGPLPKIGQVPFTSQTYGFGTGFETVLNHQFVVEGGLGYTHSNIQWKQNYGNGNWSSLYIAPFFGWFNQNAFANVMCMGVFNFHQLNRKIVFSGFERTAKSSFNSYDFLIRLNGGVRFYLKKGFWLEPEGTLNTLFTRTESFQEKDAVGLNLHVNSRSDTVMQPSLRFNFLKEFTSKTMYFAPKIYLGWLSDILFHSQNTHARFNSAPNYFLFETIGYRETTDQLIVGAQLYAQKYNQFLWTINFETALFSKLEVYTAKAKFEWMF